MSTTTASDLVTKECTPCEGGTAALNGPQIQDLMKALSGWRFLNGQLEKTYHFSDYFQTMAFVNATAWVSHQQNHHPDLEVGYNRCTVHYSTHAVGGLTENDFICAARVDALL